MPTIYDLLDQYTTDIRPFKGTPVKGSDGKFHYIYCTLNLVNNKFYLGKHTHENWSNTYIGSGVYLNASIKKHGMDNFHKFVVKFFNTEAEAYDAERQIITEKMVKSEDCYNRTSGGKGFYGSPMHPVYQQIADGKNLFVSDNPVYAQIKSGKNKFVTDNPVYKQIEEGKNVFVTDNPVYKQTAEGKNALVGVKPWNHYFCGEKSKYVWWNADIFYQIYLINKNLRKPVLLGKQAKIHGIDTDKVSRRSVQSVLAKFQAGWIPEKDADWTEFKESCLS